MPYSGCPPRYVAISQRLDRHSVLFANAIDVINQLSAAQKRSTLKSELKKYLRPRLLILYEIGYLPIDQHGADLLYKVISPRYECSYLPKARPPFGSLCQRYRRYQPIECRPKKEHPQKRAQEIPPPPASRSEERR